MELASSLAALGDGTLPESFEGLKSHVDVEWIQSALARHGVATLRRRKLPAEQVVWLVIGMALYRDRPIAEIVERLDLVLPESDGQRGTLAQGAIPPARDRVGVEPLRSLFETTAQNWALGSAERHRWRGLLVLGADGTCLRVPDTPENREAFGLPESGGRRSAGYPLTRVAALMALRGRLLLDFGIGSYRTDERDLVKPMLDRVPAQSLVVLDRHFVNYPLLDGFHHSGQDRHWLLRLRAGLKWKVVKNLGPGDALVEIEFSAKARRLHPDLPRSFKARLIKSRRKGYRGRVLLTSLLDSKRYPAAEIAGLYDERWELELGYDEIKTDTLDRLECIRSKAPERVKQELWGLVIAYNLVRREMEAVASRLGVPPRRISFRIAFRLVRDLFMWAAVASPGSLPKMVEGLRLDMARFVLPERRNERRYSRAVKIKMSNYARNDSHPN